MAVVEFIPYAQRESTPKIDDLHVLREHLSIQTEIYGRRSYEAQMAFEHLFAASIRVGRPLDALRQYSPVESERFFAQTREGIDGHVYWTGAKHFRRNDGKSRVPRRWWWEDLHGPTSITCDVMPTCGQSACINPDHCIGGRSTARRYFTDDQMLGAIQVATMQLGVVPSTKVWREKNYHPTPSVYALRFGSWEAAVKAAGLGDRYAVEGRPNKATPELAIKSVKEARRYLGHAPLHDEYQSDPLRAHLRGLGLLTSCSAIRKQIGPSWGDSVKRALS